MLEVWLKKSRKRRIEQGHPWVFRNEIEKTTGDPATGDVVQVKNHQGHFLAQGFYHEVSQIAVRVVTYSEKEKVDDRFLREKMKQAWQHRKRVLRHTASCRAIYGEADGLPGLVVDKYEQVAVVQILSAAMDKRKEAIVKAIVDVLGVKAVYERSDAPVRQLEGLELSSGCLYGECPSSVTIKENGLQLEVNLVEGQKTGHFFDQRENRAAIAPFVRFSTEEKPRPDQHYDEQKAHLATDSNRVGATVLDCFSHTGAFAMHALMYGAAHVTLVDASEVALSQAKINAELNGYLDRASFEVVNAFDYLRQAEQEKQQFDVVILDPPAFAKHKKAVEQALKGYKEINLRGLKLVKDGGFLVTASCSSPVTRQEWLEIIHEAAMDAHKLLRMIEYRSTGKDHPQLLGMPENDYLKFAIFEVKPRTY